MNRTLPGAFALLLGLTLTGCSSDPTTDTGSAPASAMAADEGASAMATDDSAMAKDGGAMANDDSTMEGDGAMDADDAAMDSEGATSQEGAWINYSAYDSDPATYHGSGDVVLFFNASWCPTCQASVRSLDADGVPAGLTVVSVDYDGATDLKRQYGVTVQHTYVQVDQDGNELAKWTGSVSGEDIAAQTV